jgi:NADPH:quinone reductase
MAFDGRLLTLGYASGQIPKIPANLLLVKNFSVHGVFFGSHAINRPEVFHDSVTSVLKLWKDGKIRPHIGKIFNLREVCVSQFSTNIPRV